MGEMWEPEKTDREQEPREMQYVEPCAGSPSMEEEEDISYESPIEERD